MSELNTTLPPALRRALELLADPPAQPDVSRGYLDLLGPGSVEDADAQRLPLRDTTVDAVVSMAVLQLRPDPVAALAEMARVLRRGGRLAVLVPTAGRAARLWRRMPNVGANVFGEDELGDIMEDHGFCSVRTKNSALFQWVRAKRG